MLSTIASDLSWLSSEVLTFRDSPCRFERGDELDDSSMLVGRRRSAVSKWNEQRVLESRCHWLELAMVVFHKWIQVQCIFRELRVVFLLVRSFC